ncbi:DUF6916 family protein [Glaciimonas sp. GG7]
MTMLTLELFTPLVNDNFVCPDEGNTCFVLTEAQALAGSGAVVEGAVISMTRAPFSLLFRNDSAVMFKQKIYGLHHAAIGETDIFLVPVGRAGMGFLYEAVFN